MPVTINGTTGIVTPAENTSALTVGSISGILKASSGVVSQAVAGTDYLVGGGSAIPSTNTAKAWVNFDGTTSPPTIRSNYNVSSVTKNGTGDYTVNFSTSMTDANYSVSGICASGANITYTGTTVPYVCGPQAAPTTSQFRFGTGAGAVGGGAGTRADQSYIYIQVFAN